MCSDMSKNYHGNHTYNLSLGNHWGWMDSRLLREGKLLLFQLL